jgi:thioredoxin-like negative regulator of GroEL
MAEKRKIEVFSAGCAPCDGLVSLVERLACASCEVTVVDMRAPEVAMRAMALGIRVVPAVAVVGQVAGCCQGVSPTEQGL